MSAARPRTLILTGAGRGIGRATALALAARGDRLGLIDRDPEGLASLAEVLRGAGQTKFLTAVADVSQAGAVQAAVAEFERAHGPTDTLVACAGVGMISNVHDLKTAGLRTMLEVNVLGVAHAIEAVLPGMMERGRGHIVGIASVAGFRGMPWMPGYSASKAALATYLEALRPALKRRGVRITTVHPGFVRTGMTVETPFARPVPMLEAEQAAAYLVRAIDRGPRDCVFPFSARLGMGLLRRLPDRLFDWSMDRAGPRALTSEF